jgi:hypothetical protein
MHQTMPHLLHNQQYLLPKKTTPLPKNLAQKQFPSPSPKMTTNPVCRPLTETAPRLIAITINILLQ